MHTAVTAQFIVHTVLLSCVMLLCACDTRLVKHRIDTNVRLHLDPGHLDHYCHDHQAGMHINNLGLSHSFDMDWGGALFLGGGGSLFMHPVRIPGEGPDQEYRMGGFATTGIRANNVSFSVTASSDHDQYAVAASMLINVGHRRRGHLLTGH